MTTEPTVFLRKSSGLVKAASTTDVFIFNTGLISIGIGVLYTHLYGPANYPKGDIGLASLFATVAMLAIGAGMWAWTVTMPRSGAIYVFLSRGANPALGFALSFVDALCWLFYNAVAAVLFSTAGLAPFFVSLYLVTGNHSYLGIAEQLNRPVVSAFFGSVLIGICGLLLLLGMRRFFVLQKVMFVVASAGTLLLVVCLAGYDRHDLIANLARLGTTELPSFDAVLEGARSAGLVVGGHDLWESLRLSVWPFLPLIGGAFSIAIAGEIRNVGRGQGVGILGSIGVCGIVFAAIGWLSYRSIGAEFQSAVTYLHQIRSPDGLPVVPYFSTLVALLVGSPALMLLICVGFVAWIYFWIPGMLAYAERVMLAWAFDRVAPAALGTVNARYQTPTVAIGVSVACSIGLTWLYACTSFFNTLIFIEAATWAWLVTAVVGIGFPWRRPHLAGMSPLGGRRFLGIPLLSALNLLSSIALIWMGYLLWMDPLAAGHEPKSLATIGGAFAIGLVCFYGMRAYRRRQGIDISLAYREIPIE